MPRSRYIGKIIHVFAEGSSITSDARIDTDSILDFGDWLSKTIEFYRMALNATPSANWFGVTIEFNLGNASREIYITRDGEGTVEVYEDI